MISEDFGVGPSTNHGSSFDRLPPPGNPVEYFEISDGEDGKNETTVPRLDISADEDEQQAKSMQRYRMKPPTDQRKILALFQPWSEGLLTLDFRIDDGFTPVGLQFLSACVIGWHEDVKEIHIYTDGSYDRRHDVSSFAFAVFGWNADIDDKHYFLGWSGSIVCTDTEGRNYLGAQTHSAGDGEVSALLWAILWILQSPIWCPHTLHFDSMVARFTASGDWQFDEANLHKKKLKEVAQMAEAVSPGMIQFSHVKAHSNHPCNNLIDGFARQTIAHGHNEKAVTPDWRPLLKQESHQLS